ncbi:uncharacterized protein LOC125025251 [Penaeus chinensis]|uniref:uncharacterized protein LOC125025251 n=1 Tax=Penaeus chinensis TaxID=139456 RepID=UPI001FB8107C|nr:uncharacterized protein LOC125025251 [Penaeus chinensis]
MIGGRFEALLEVEENDLQHLTSEFSKGMDEIAMEVLGKARTRKQPWMTQGILDACDRRRELKARKFKDSDTEKEYRNANIMVSKEIRKAKEAFLEQICQEIEQGFEGNNSKKTFDTIKQLNREKCARQSVIEDKNDNLFTESSMIQERWTEYVKELYRYPIQTSPEIIKEPLKMLTLTSQEEK